MAAQRCVAPALVIPGAAARSRLLTPLLLCCSFIHSVPMCAFVDTHSRVCLCPCRKLQGRAASPFFESGLLPKFQVLPRTPCTARRRARSSSALPHVAPSRPAPQAQLLLGLRGLPAPMTSSTQCLCCRAAGQSWLHTAAPPGSPSSPLPAWKLHTRWLYCCVW